MRPPPAWSSGFLARWCVAFAVTLSVVPGDVAAQDGRGTLVGVARDSSGAPIARADVVLRHGLDELRRIVADDRGHFVLGDVSPGAYLVWIRRMGFTSAEYNWAATAGQRDSINVTLREVPRGLDAVVVRAREERDMSGSAQLLGLVIDTEGNPVPEANVELVGADRAGETRENGGFLFWPLPVGSYVVRVRKIGFVPQSVTTQLRTGEEREMIVRLHPLMTSLATVNVVAASGFDSRAERVLKDLDTRLRWRSARDVLMGPNEMLRFAGRALDVVNGAQGMPIRTVFRQRGVRSINPAGVRGVIGVPTIGADGGSACIVENGSRLVHQPLSSYNASDVELLEIYDGYGDDTHTLDVYMTGRCARGADGRHPFWYVVWLKGRDR